MESRQIEDAKKLERDSNMELLRIVFMLLVMVCHADYMSLGGPSQSDILCNAGGTFTKIFIFAFSMVCVNGFILISGWYGIHASTISSIFHLWLLITIVFTIEPS